LLLKEKHKILQANPLGNVSEQLRALTLKMREKEKEKDLPATRVSAPAPASISLQSASVDFPPAVEAISSRSSSQTYLQEFESAFSDDDDVGEGGVEAGYDSSNADGARSQSSLSEEDERHRRDSSSSDLSDHETPNSTKKEKGAGKRSQQQTAGSLSSSPSNSQRQPRSGSSSKTQTRESLASSNVVLFYQGLLIFFLSPSLPCEFFPDRFCNLSPCSQRRMARPYLPTNLCSTLSLRIEATWRVFLT